MPKKKSHPFGISPEEVKRSKRRRSAKKMADVENLKGSMDEWFKRYYGVKDLGQLERRKSAHKLADFEKGTTSFKKLDRHTLGARAKRWDNWVRSVKRARKRNKELETATSQIKHGGKVSRKKGGTASHKSGGKIMYGYKAGGKV